MEKLIMWDTYHKLISVNLNYIHVKCDYLYKPSISCRFTASKPRNANMSPVLLNISGIQLAVLCQITH